MLGERDVRVQRSAPIPMPAKQVVESTVQSAASDEAGPVALSVAQVDEAKRPKQKLICHSCAEPVPYNVAKFYWFNKPKFGGNIYCMECLKKAVANAS